MQIDIDFEVFKSLTALRESESVSYNEVIRRLLKLGPKPADGADSNSTEEAREASYIAVGRRLPHGTKLQARYKGTLHSGEVCRGRIVTEGKTYTSLSAAAKGITSTNVNGLRFWYAKRPGDLEWTLVAGLKKDPSRDGN